MSRFQSTRRQFFGLAAGGAAATALTIPHESQARTQTRARIVIIGAGAGGTALANRLVRRLEEARITLIDPRAQHRATCDEGCQSTSNRARAHADDHKELCHCAAFKSPDTGG